MTLKVQCNDGTIFDLTPWQLSKVEELHPTLVQKTGGGHPQLPAAYFGKPSTALAEILRTLPAEPKPSPEPIPDEPSPPPAPPPVPDPMPEPLSQLERIANALEYLADLQAGFHPVEIEKANQINAKLTRILTLLETLVSKS